jgi:hypothetical protein
MDIQNQGNTLTNRLQTGLEEVEEQHPQCGNVILFQSSDCFTGCLLSIGACLNFPHLYTDLYIPVLLPTLRHTLNLTHARSIQDPSNCLLFVPPFSSNDDAFKYKRRFGHSFLHFAPKMWNSLPLK